MSAVRMEKIESTIRLAIEFRARLERGDFDGAAGLLSERCLIDAPEGVYSGREEARRYLERRERARLGATHDVEEMFGMGLRCVVRIREGKMRSLELYKEERGALSEILIYSKEDRARDIGR